MADTYTFVKPDWLNGQDADTIHERMMNNLPEDIDTTEGGFPWDFTKPTALEKAELLEFEMLEAVKIMFFQWAYGVYLDFHAAAAGLTRKAAAYATGTVDVTGSPGLDIPAGFLFAAPASGDTAAVVFASTEDAVLDYDGKATIPIQATEPGIGGNVKAGTIVIMASNAISGVESITNSAATSGGAAEEDDDDLRARIAEVYSSTDASFIGCDSDYKRWALEVSGVKSVIVIPEWDGPGTVELVLMSEDESGGIIPAPASIVSAVYNHIVSPRNRANRLAPIGATVTCIAPNTIPISVTFSLKLENGADYTSVIQAITSNLTNYFEEAQADGIVRRSKIGSVISGTEGVYDYQHLLVNGERDNVPVGENQFPVLNTLTPTLMNGEEE